MNSGMKLAATFIIWTAFTIIMTTGHSPLAEATGGAAVMMTVVLAIAAAASSVAVWQSGEQNALKREAAEKAKRTRTRVGRFVDTLSNEEIAELRARLTADDGEVVPLDALLSQQGKSQYRERD